MAKNILKIAKTILGIQHPRFVMDAAQAESNDLL